MIREQASLLANLAWEQQIHICNLNDKYLRLLEERKRLADMSHKPVYDSVDLINNTMKDIVNDTMKNLQEKINVLQETLNQRHDDMSRLLTPVDVTKIMDTLIELATRNADLVRSNNRLTKELSFMPPQMHDKIMQAKKSHSKIYIDQRADPHYLVPEKPTDFAYDRANPSDKRLSLLQRHATHVSIRELLDETRDINQLMTDSHEHDHKDQDTFDGDNIADDSGFNPWQSAPAPRNVQESSSGEDATKRSHDSIVHTGHRVHPPKVQKMNSTAPVQETLQKEAEPVEQDDRVGTAWHARYMQRVKDGTPSAYEQLMQSKANLPNQGTNTQSDPMNQNSSVSSTYMQADAFPPLEVQMSVVGSTSKPLLANWTRVRTVQHQQ